MLTSEPTPFPALPEPRDTHPDHTAPLFQSMIERTRRPFPRGGDALRGPVERGLSVLKLVGCSRGAAGGGDDLDELR